MKKLKKRGSDIITKIKKGVPNGYYEVVIRYTEKMPSNSLSFIEEEIKRIVRVSIIVGTVRIEKVDK